MTNFRLFLSSLAVVTLSLYSTKCSIGPKDDVIPVCEGGATLGQTRTAACTNGQLGQIVEACTKDGWLEAANSCNTNCNITAFDDIKPILNDYCIGCHATINTYSVAKNWSPEISRRVGLPLGDGDHMPLNTSPKQLGVGEINNLQKWVADGAQEKVDCVNPLPKGFIPLDYIENVMAKDLSNLSASTRAATRYLITAHKNNEVILGAENPVEIKIIEAALNKQLNSLNPKIQDLSKILPIDEAKTVWRIDLRLFDIDAEDEAAIAAADTVNIVSNTSKGEVIRTLTGVDKPWYHADNFMVITQSPNIYYRLLNIPPTLADFQKNINVDFAEELKDLEAFFLGTTYSPIAEQKNRLIVRVKGGVNQASYYWQTFDINNEPTADVQVTGDLAQNSNIITNLASTAGIVPGQLITANGINAGTKVVAVDAGQRQVTMTAAAIAAIGNNQITFNGINTKNLFQVPLLAETGGQENFTHDASEVIYTLPNGLQGYALFDAKGARQNEAPITVVADNKSPVTPIIINAISCTRCHSAGLISMQDQILDHVNANAAQFNPVSDVQLVQQLYHNSASNQAIFAADRKTFARAMNTIGVDAQDADPITQVTDQLQLNWDAQRAAAFLFLTKEEFAQALNTSPTAKNQIGQLLTGGTVTFQQFTLVIQQLIKDAALFQDEE